MEDVKASVPGFVVSFAGLSRAQIASAIKTALAQVAGEVLTGVKGDDPVAKVQRTYLHFIKDAFPNLYGATVFRVRSATDTVASTTPKKARAFKQQQVWYVALRAQMTVVTFCANPSHNLTLVPPHIIYVFFSLPQARFLLPWRHVALAQRCILQLRAHDGRAARGAKRQRRGREWSDQGTAAGLHRLLQLHGSASSSSWY